MTAASNSESRKRLASPVDPVEVVARAINPSAFESDAILSKAFARDQARRSIAALRENGFL